MSPERNSPTTEEAVKSQKAILQHRKPQLGSTHIFLECDQSFLTCKEPFCWRRAMRPLVLSLASYHTYVTCYTRCDLLLGTNCKIWGAVLKHVCFSRHFAYVASDITRFHITLV